MLPSGVAGARTAHRHLVDQRGVLLVYADEERRGHVSAPLFGRPVPRRANVLNIIRLAWASRAVVIPAYAERLAGARFRVTYCRRWSWHRRPRIPPPRSARMSSASIG